MPFLYDLVNPGPGVDTGGQRLQKGSSTFADRPMFAGEDWGGSGFLPESAPQGGWGDSPLLAPPPQDASATPSGWTNVLKQLVQQQYGGRGGGQATPQMAAPVRAPARAQPMPSSQAPSQKGLGGNSRKGFDMQSLMALASLWFGGAGLLGGAGAGAIGGGLPMGAAAGGAAGGAGAMGGAAGSGGGGFLSGLMGGGGGGGGNFLSGLMGGGGGGGSAPTAPAISFAPVAESAPPLIPQNANQWDVPRYNPWQFVG